MNYNPKNVQQAKAAAQRIYKKVNFQGGNLQTYQISSLMQQTYQFLKIPFKPTTNDIKDYSKVLDANGDGQVSLKDLEEIAINYLCGQGVLGDIGSKKPSSSQQSSYSKSSNSYSNQPNYPLNQYNNQQKPTNGISSYQNSQYSQYLGSSSQYQSNVERQKQLTYTFAGNKNSQQSPEHLASKQYNQPSYEQQLLQQQQNQLRSKYKENALKYLNITRSLFKRYSNQQTNTITRDKVVPLLTQTYGSLGRKGYYPSEQDVNVWMKLCDTNNDGHVEEAEYEYFVIRALERSGIQVYNQ